MFYLNNKFLIKIHGILCVQFKLNGSLIRPNQCEQTTLHVLQQHVLCHLAW